MLVIRWKGWILKAIPHHIWPFQLDSNSKRWSAGKGKKQVLKKYIYKKKKRERKKESSTLPRSWVEYFHKVDEFYFENCWVFSP